MKVLAITTNQGDPTPHLQDEARRTAELREAGVLEQIWLKKDRSGAVLILEVAGAEHARGELATLPVVARGVATFEVIELMPVPG